VIRCWLALLGALLLGCASQPPPPEPSPLRRDAQAAAEAGSTRFAGRHFAASALSFGRAAEIFGALDDPASEAAALRNQAEAQRRSGDSVAATIGFERALALDRAGERPIAQARDHSGLARCASARGEIDVAVRESDQALALVGKADALRALVEIDLAVYLLARGDAADRERIVALLVSAGDLAVALDEPRTRAAAHLHLGRAQRRFGSTELGEPPLRQALEEFRALDDPEGLARTHEEIGRLLKARNQSEAARQHLEQARRGYEFLGDAAARESVEALLGEGRE
jgi:tetratricopeptide (TPR) repeat protein